MGFTFHGVPGNNSLDSALQSDTNRHLGKPRIICWESSPLLACVHQGQAVPVSYLEVKDVVAGHRITWVDLFEVRITVDKQADLEPCSS